MLINTEATANLAQQFCVCVSLCVCEHCCVLWWVCHVLYVLCTLRALCLMELITCLTGPVSFFSLPSQLHIHGHTHTHTQGHTHRLTAQGCVAPRVMADWFFPPHFALKKTFTSYTHRHTHMPVFHLVPSASVSLNWKGTSRVQKCSEG